MSSDLVAMVPVRAGSQRVKNKNTRPFLNVTLLDLKLKNLKLLNGVDKIVVSTDCEQAAQIGDRHGVNVQWRDAYYAGSEVTNDQHWAHIAKTTPGEVVFLAQVTSPLVRLSTMERAINAFKSMSGNRSINSVSDEKKFLWKDYQPINYEILKTPKSQDLPDIVSLNFAISIITRDEMIAKKNVISEKPNFIKLSKIESLDIDDELDFEIAETILRNRGIDWLQS